MTRAWITLLACAAASGFFGCAGEPFQVDSGPPRPTETVLGQTEGEATGLMLFQVIPIGQNTRFLDAYKQAMAKYPSATRIADMTISENWFWAWLLNGYVTKVQGTAVSPGENRAKKNSASGKRKARPAQ